MEECLDFVVENLDQIRGEYVCVSNAHTTVMAHDDPAYRIIQAESIMAIPDGKPLSVIGRKQAPGMERVTGPDLMRALFSAPEARNRSHYFYGNTPGNLGKLLEALLTAYPNLQVAGFEPSVFHELTPCEEKELANRINASSADYIWIGIGAPRQEVLCHRLKGRVCGLMVGVGGAFNILAGVTPEAPAWMKRLCLEWLFRLMQEPTRLFKRYLVTNTKFIFYHMFRIKPRGGLA